MKTKFKLAYLLALSVSLSAIAEAKTVCTMTFNSKNEKQVFEKNLSPLGYDIKELVPENKNPVWFQEACQSQIQCDIIVISGHFGGLFFGEQNSTTLSVQELIQAREKKSCSNILNAEAVYLMGCNTLASKIKDHRTIDQYLRVLVNDGFPLNLAESVASARYLNFGQSMSEIMSQIFNESKMIVGFDSTGPLGAQSAPLLQKAFNASTAQDKSSTGISAVALKAQFARHNLRLISPQAHKGDEIFAKALGANSIDSTAAWREILSSNQSVKRYYDFIMRQSENATLVALVQRDMIIKVNVANGFSEVIKMAKGLSAIQLKTLNLLKRFRLIEDAEHQSEIQKVVSQILTKPIDYVSADQLCEIFKKQKSSVISREHEAKISKSEYSEFLNKCRGLNVKVYYSNVFKCLVGDGSRRSDWDCLTQYASELDVESCKFAKARNTDPENADDMVWFCYDQLKNWGQLNKPVCLELTHSFSILGNQLKMNWNCLNRVQ